MTISKNDAGKLGWLASKVTNEKQKQERIEEYNKNPNKCLFCGEVLNYKHRHNKFCNRSCAASYNNPLKADIRNCIICGNKLKSTQAKFCSKSCNSKYIRQQRYKNHILENGDIVNCNEQTARRIAKDWLEEYNGHKCEMCGNTEWLGKPILLIADHIDGDPTHNNIHNFRLLCSNCDATLDTYKNKNKIKNKRNNRKKYYSNI